LEAGAAILAPALAPIAAPAAIVGLLGYGVWELSQNDGAGFKAIGNALLNTFDPNRTASAQDLNVVGNLAGGLISGKFTKPATNLGTMAVEEAAAGVKSLRAPRAPPSGFEPPPPQALVAEGVEGAADAVEGLPAGKLYGERRLEVLRKHLEKRGVELNVGDEFLLPGQGGGFAVRPNGAARMVLRSNPTEYVVTHELGHYVHWRGLGTDAYLKLPRTPKWNAAEQFVFDQLEKPTRWWRFSDAERQHAIDYIERVGFR
jgi:hypothetical protein